MSKITKTTQPTKTKAVRRNTVRGIKGGEAAVEKAGPIIKRTIRQQPKLQNFLDTTVKTTKKIGKKGGVAALAGGAAGLAIGAIAGAALSHGRNKTFGERVNEIAKSAENLQEEIKKAQK